MSKIHNFQIGQEYKIDEMDLYTQIVLFGEAFVRAYHDKSNLDAPIQFEVLKVDQVNKSITFGTSDER